ncbi:MAG: MATE family efflux transporter, partial [Proteobacteria bacterium]|nr:MATE family efflux transporter [Pseudomonadota bacterium]
MLSPGSFPDAPDAPAARPTPAARGQARRLVLLEGPVGATLARLALPNIAVVAAQTLVTFADAWYVGRLGVAGLAALALVFPVQAMMSMMSAGAMGGGISAAVARALGAGDRERAEALVIHALLIGLGMATGFTLLFGVLAQPFFLL